MRRKFTHHVRKNYFKALALLFIIIQISCLSCYAQIETKFLKPDELPEGGKYKLKQVPKKIKMEAVDTESLLAENIKEKGKVKPLRFGKMIDTDLSLNDGSWERVENGRVWRLNIESNKAFSINLIFDEFYLPEGAEFFVYDADRTMIYGPVISNQNNNEHIFATDLIKGQSIILELFEPDKTRSLSKIHINKVVHAFVNMFPMVGTFGESAVCNIDIACPEGNNWQEESKAVAMVIRGDRYGTGTMVNNANQDYKKYFLSALHVFDSEEDGFLNSAELNAISTTVFRFHYKSTTCNGTTAPTSYHSSTGASVKSYWSGTDFILLELNSSLTKFSLSSDITFAGWTLDYNYTTGYNNVSSTVGIHHPMGDVMKISVDNHAPTTYSFYPERIFVEWDKGITQLGSSGSPLFNQNRKLIGVLEGGSLNECGGNTINQYNAFSYSWTGNGTPQTQLSYWLGGQNVTQTNTVNISCSSMLNNSISGPNQLCHYTNGYTFSKNPTELNPSPGEIAWSTTGNIYIPAGQPTDGNSVTINTTGSGTGTVILAVTRNGCGTKVFSKTVTVSSCGRLISNTSEIANAKENENTGLLTMSPNPTWDNLKISLKDDSKNIKEVQVIDKLGIIKKKVQNDSNGKSVIIDLTYLPADLYIVRVFNGKEWESSKIIKK